MKKLLSLVLVCAMTIALVGCGQKAERVDNGSGSDKSSAKKIGAILLGDETEGYTLAHINGIKEAAKELGISDSDIVWKYNISESDEVSKAADQLVAQGCKLIISNSYGHQDYMYAAAQKYTDVDFVAMTGDYAAISGCDNFYNAFTKVYESRYVSGVVAGMKIAELVNEDKIPATGYDADGNVKVGYVGAYPYAEVVSGYTAFYLGIKSVYDQVAMEVSYTDSWFDIEGEGAAAESLMADGCVIIGQHADSTGAPSAVQAAQDSSNTVAFSVGYNVDMLDVAKTAALTSATNNWAAYYTTLFKAYEDGKEIPQNWAEGYDADAVAITKLGDSCAEGTAEKVAEVEAALKDGSLHVFDTSKFTVTGKNVKKNEDNGLNLEIDDNGAVTSNKIDLSIIDFATGDVTYKGDTVEAIVKDDNGATYFDESSFRSAPYFQIRIDGITELNK